MVDIDTYGYTVGNELTVYIQKTVLVHKIALLEEYSKHKTYLKLLEILFCTSTAFNLFLFYDFGRHFLIFVYLTTLFIILLSLQI